MHNCNCEQQCETIVNRNKRTVTHLKQGEVRLPPGRDFAQKFGGWFSWRGRLNGAAGGSGEERRGEERLYGGQGEGGSNNGPNIQQLP